MVFVAFLLHHFVALTLIHSVAAEGNHARTQVKSCLRKRTAFSAESEQLSLLFLQSEHFNRSAFPKVDKACEAIV